MPPFDAETPVNLGDRAAGPMRDTAALRKAQAERDKAQADRERGARALAVTVHALAGIGRHPRFAAAAMALCNEVASRWRAERVSLAMAGRRGARLTAMGRTEEIDRKVALCRAVEDCADEVLDQGAEVAWPPRPGEPVVARAARSLAERFGPHDVLALPLRDVDGRPEAVLVVEISPGRDLSPEDRDGLRLLITLSAPLLLRLHQDDRPPWERAGAAAGAMGRAAVGPHHAGAKLAGLAAVAVLALLTLVPVPARVTTQFEVQAVEQRVIAAPFDGYLRTVSVLPGAAVSGGGTVLAEMETSELRLQLAARLAERERHLREAALGTRDGNTADAAIAQARADAVGAEIGLLRDRIARATLTAPIDGVVLEGDRMRQVGGAVQRGEALFQVAPLDRLRVELRVPENRIDDLKVGQTGMLRAAARPDRPIPVTIDRIEPMAAALDGSNVFRAWARFDATDPTDGNGAGNTFGGGAVPDWVRPGMEGVAKVRVGTASLLWLWTRDAVDWVRMKLWW